MVFHILLMLLISSLSCIPSSESSLTLDYYAKTCPKFEDIMRDVAHTKQSTNPTTAAAVLRVFFHDCVVEGCDASVLIRSTPFNHSERDNDINHSLAGDAFDLITRAKTALELACPNVVSCADILAVAARNLVTITGGPHFKVLLGRKDGLVSQAKHVEGNLARANVTMDQMIPMFTSKGFTIQEMVALVGGGHTIGFAHCSNFMKRIFGPNVDKSMNPKLSEALRMLCGNSTGKPVKSAFLDVMSPGTFDNTIFKSINRGLAVLSSDHMLSTDPRTKPFVDKYSEDNQLFFDDFARAMEKLSVYGIKTGGEGEVRKRCDSFNVAKA